MVVRHYLLKVTLAEPGEHCSDEALCRHRSTGAGLSAYKVLPPTFILPLDCVRLTTSHPAPHISVRQPRPFIERIDSECKDGTPILNGAAPNTLVLPENFETGAAEKGYKFHRVFNPELGNSGVYDECYQELVEKACEGYNVTIFAYGQTGDKKS